MRSVDLPAPSSPDGREVLVPDTRGEWREWLDAHPDRSEGVWVAYPKKSSEVQGPGYDDLVEEALCFGWIDSVARRADDDRTLQWFSPRRKGGIWSRSNKERVERLAARGLMTPRGQAVIDAARADGSWSQYDDVEEMVVHSDLAAALDSAPGARARYEGLAPSRKKQYLWWVYSAKRSDTRQGRIAEMIRRLTQGE
ncbi:MAG: YdeI/OmpD-associated family protein [Actinomycetota bacterium]